MADKDDKDNKKSGSGQKKSGQGSGKK